MRKGLAAIFIICLMAFCIAASGCKGKVANEQDMQKAESTEATVPQEEVVVNQTPVTEPAAAQTVSQEQIPPTAAVPQEAGKAAPAQSLERNKEIQSALKAANFYTGNVDGKMGPKTKRAIIEFQKAKGLKADGKVGQKTWMELDKYLKQ